MSDIFPETDDVRNIVRAVKDINLEEWRDVWDKLKVLSDHTIIDGTQVDPAGIIVRDGWFSGLLNIYVALQYNGDGGGFTDSDSFLGEFEGRLGPSDTPKIEKISVDTSHFYTTTSSGQMA